MDSGPSAPRGEELQVHGRFLRALARGLVADPARAEDLLQDTYVRALAHPARHGTAPRAWLAQILRRLAWKQGVREGERAVREQDAGDERAACESVDPPSLLAELELARGVLEAVERLREPYRGTIYLRYYRGLTPQRIAAEQGVPVKTVKTRLLRALELLRSELDRRTGGREAWVALLLPLAQSDVPAPLGRALPLGATPGLALGAVGLALLLGGAWFFLHAPPPAGPEPQAALVQDLAPARSPAPVASGAREAREAAPRSVSAFDVAPQGVRLRGRVLTSSGTDLAGAAVHAQLLAGARRGPRPEEALEDLRTTSDAEGAFALELTQAGMVRIEVERDGFAPEGRRLAVYLGQRLALEPFVLAPGATLAGHVLDPAGKPVAGAELWQAREDQGLVFGADAELVVLAAKTDALGRFRIERQALGAWSLEARAPGFAPATLAGTTAAGEELDGLEFTLAPGLSIAGRVLGLTAEERVEARVLALRTGAAPETAQRSVRVPLDERGAFVLDSLAPEEERELVLVQGDDEWLRFRGEPVLARAGAQDVLLEARASATSRPHEREHESDPPAEPLGDATLEIHVQRPDGTPASGALVARRAAARGRGPGEVRAADAEGLLLWPALPAGSQRFAAVTGGFGSEDGEEENGKTIELSAGGRTTLELTCAPSADLTGVVRTAGMPLADARIWLRTPGRGPFGAGPALLARTDSDGRFAFRGLPFGSYHLELLHASRARPETRDLELGAGGLELDLDLADGRLAGRVRADGASVAGATVRVLDGAGAGRSFGPRTEAGATTTDAAGGFELLGIDPGAAVRLEVVATGHATLQTPALAPESFAELVLQPEALLDLALVLGGSDARPGVALRAEGPGGEALTFALNSGTRTTLHGLGAGPWRLVLLRGGRGTRGEPPETRTIELEPGRTTELAWTVR